MKLLMMSSNTLKITAGTDSSGRFFASDARGLASNEVADFCDDDNGDNRDVPWVSGRWGDVFVVVREGKGFAVEVWGWGLSSILTEDT